MYVGILLNAAVDIDVAYRRKNNIAGYEASSSNMVLKIFIETIGLKLGNNLIACTLLMK